MPARVIREGLLDSDAIGAAGERAETLFVRLMLVADDFGRFDGRVTVICRRCWPNGGPTEKDVAERLAALAREGLIVLYQFDGKPFISIPKFNQRTRADKSKYPDPPDNEPTTDGAMPAECPTNDSGPRTLFGVVVGGGGEGGAAARRGPGAGVPLDDFVKAYHDELPDHPRCVALSDERRKHIRARWNFWLEKGKYRTTEEGLAWWRKFFGYVATSPFLTGRAKPREGREPFFARIDHLVDPTMHIEIVEGKYHEGQVQAATA